MPRAEIAALSPEMTLEERRERRRLRREKQREDNFRRAAKMHAARVKAEAETTQPLPAFRQSAFVGCSGWRYWKWRASFYTEVPQPDWFEHYLKSFETLSRSTHPFTRGQRLQPSRPGGARPARRNSSTPSRSANS